MKTFKALNPSLKKPILKMTLLNMNKIGTDIEK